MAQIASFLWLRHLRAEPNQFVLHFKDGRISERGPGKNYWFSSYSAAIAQLPVEDVETTFMLKERSSDHQEVVVQLTLSYRVTDPEKAAARTNFTISIDTGAWIDPPLERLASLWSSRAQPSARAYVASVPVVVALREGAERIRSAVREALTSDAEIREMGLGIVRVEVDRVSATSEVEKALQTPTREQIQQKADEAVFSRRALAVEKERAIKENELATQIELARRAEDLIQQQAENKRLEAESEAIAERRRTEGVIEREALAADAYAKQKKTRSEADAAAERVIGQAKAESERAHVEVYSGAPPNVAVGLALQEAAKNIQKVQHLNITPDMLSAALQSFVGERSGR